MTDPFTALQRVAAALDEAPNFPDDVAAVLVKVKLLHYDHRRRLIFTPPSTSYADLKLRRTRSGGVQAYVYGAGTFTLSPETAEPFLLWVQRALSWEAKWKAAHRIRMDPAMKVEPARMPVRALPPNQRDDPTAEKPSPDFLTAIKDDARTVVEGFERMLEPLGCAPLHGESDQFTGSYLHRLIVGVEDPGVVPPPLDFGDGELRVLAAQVWQEPLSRLLGARAGHPQAEQFLARLLHHPRWQRRRYEPTLQELRDWVYGRE